MATIGRHLRLCRCFQGCFFSCDDHGDNHDDHCHGDNHDDHFYDDNHDDIYDVLCDNRDNDNPGEDFHDD